MDIATKKSDNIYQNVSFQNREFLGHQAKQSDDYFSPIAFQLQQI